MVKRIQLFAVLLLAASGAHAASLYTETFESSLAGWSDRDALKMTVTHAAGAGHPGDAMQGAFSSQGIPVPEQDAFVATGALASAAFVGNYSAVTGLLIGFDFQAVEVLPAQLVLRLRSGTHRIERFLTSTLVATGLWHRLRIPLTSAPDGGWSGNTEVFSAILTNVTRWEIEITRNTGAAQRYRVDNVFLDSLPVADALTPEFIRWADLRTQEFYRCEAASDGAVPVWTEVESFLATSRTHQIGFSATQDPQIFRLLMK